MLSKTIKMMMKSLFVSAILTLMLIPAFAQFTNGFDLDKGPTTVAVLDFVNQTSHRLNNPGGIVASAVALSFERDKTLQFETVDPAVVSAAIRELGYSSSIVTDATLLAQLADHIGINNIVSGEIRRIEIIRDGSGTYAEVTVHAKVINRVTQRPINGATVTQRSSSIYGYTGNSDTLINEALTASGYKLVQTMLANRFPYTSVILSSDPQAIQLRGNNGWRVGQEAVAIRSGFRTATLRVTNVTNSTTICRTIETTRGVSTSDMVVAVYEEKFDGVPPGPNGPGGGNKSWITIAGSIALGAGIYMLAGNVDKQWRWGDAPSAYPIANIAMTPITPTPGASANYPYAGNYVTWSHIDGAANRVAYVIYRDEPGGIGANFRDVPIAVVPGNQTYYYDMVPADYYSSGSFPVLPAGERATYISYTYELTNEANAMSVTLTPEGPIRDVNYMWPLSDFNLNVPDTNFVVSDDTSYTVGVLNRAPRFGDMLRYRVEAVYIATDTSAEASSSDEERTYVMKTAMSSLSANSTYMKYPVYEALIDGDSISIILSGDDLQKAAYKVYVDRFKLQISTTADFSSVLGEISNDYIDKDTLSFPNIQNHFTNVNINTLKQYYFRVGIAPISSATQPKVAPANGFALPADKSGTMNGFVWSYPTQIIASVNPSSRALNGSKANVSKSGVLSRNGVNEVFMPNSKGGNGGRTVQSKGRSVLF